MAAPNYDAMDEDEDAAAAAEEGEAAADEAIDDDEFLMHAEEAGFTGEKAQALWRAIARCAELAGSLPPEEADEPLV